MRKKEIPVLNHVLLQLVLRRLFLPLLIIWIIAIGGVGYFLMQTLVDQQKQTVKSMAQMIDRHLDQGGRILDAVARVAEVISTEDMTIFMQSTWEAYRHFDTIYYLDENSKIALMVPSDPMYLGLDMSNLQNFQRNLAKQSITISRPFISLHTGAPTVYLVRSLSRGGCVVGELSLATFQNEISRDRDATEKDSIFILDQSGTLLAHPAQDLVKQQTNMSYLEIFNKGLSGDVTLVYEYGGTKFLGNAAQVPRVGWVIIDQIPLALLLRPYAMTFGVTILVMLGICLTLVWNLRKQFERNVVSPLVTLSQSTDALAIGDYSKVSILDSVPTTFIELNRLVTDFQRMSITLQIRQTALRESEERYRGLFEKVPTGLFRFTMEGEILDVNHAYIHMFGFPNRRALMETNGFGLYLSYEDCKQWQAVVEQEEANIFETKMQRYDKSIIWVRIRCRVVRGSDQQILYYDGSMDDITKQKQAEEALQQAYDGLEIKVQERTTALAQANQSLYSEIAERKYAEELLGQKNQELEKAYIKLKNAQSQVIQQEKLAGIGQLAAGVAHEINNPLGFVISNMGSLARYFQTMSELIHQYRKFIGMIKNKESDIEVTIVDIEEFEKKKKIGVILSDITDLINESQDGLDRISKIVVSLRTFSRIDMGNQFGEFDLNNELQNVLILARNEIKYHAEIHQELGGISSIQVIGGYINQVLLNIIVNAVQAIKMKKMQEMGVIVIRTWQEGEYVFCSITDNGIGIKEDHHSRIFDAFFTTKPVGEGTGLGLSISYDIIVNKHGGELLMESEEGLGTTITIKLPIRCHSS